MSLTLFIADPFAVLGENENAAFTLTKPIQLSFRVGFSVPQQAVHSLTQMDRPIIRQRHLLFLSIKSGLEVIELLELRLLDRRHKACPAIGVHIVEFHLRVAHDCFTSAFKGLR